MMNSIWWQVYSGMNYFFKIIDMVLLAYCLLSFFGRNTRVYAFLDRMIEPLRRPFMPITMYLARRGFPFDLSIIFVWIALSMLNSLLSQILMMFMGVW